MTDSQSAKLSDTREVASIATPSEAHMSAVSPWLTAEDFSTALSNVYDRGFVVIKNVMSADGLDAYGEILDAYMARYATGGSIFDGTVSHRLYELFG